MFHCHFLSFFFFSPNFVKGAELSTFEAQFCCILHIYTHTHYYYTYWESLLFLLLLLAVLCSHLSSLSDSYQETESAFHPTFFPLASRGKKPIKEKAILGKHCWDLTWRNLELFISFEIPPILLFLFPLTHVVLPSIKMNIKGKIIFSSIEIDGKASHK